MLPSLYHYLMDGLEIIKYDNFCQHHKCKFYSSTDCDHGICYSCMKIGESNHILEYPNDCPMLEDIKIEEQRLVKKKMWETLNGY